MESEVFNQEPTTSTEEPKKCDYGESEGTDRDRVYVMSSVDGNVVCC